MRKYKPFLLGFLSGIVLAVIYVKFNANNTSFTAKNDLINKHRPFPSLKSYESWFKSKNITREVVANDNLAINYLESQFLYEQTTVFCLVLVRNNNYVKSSKSTWIKHCNNHEFLVISNKSKDGKITLKKTRENSIWTTLCATIKSLRPNNYKWFLIVYENTFVIVENLRYLLAGLNEGGFHYLGHTVHFWGVNYNSGKAGYVLSRATVEKLQELIGKNNSCGAKTVFLNREDFYLGKTLANLGIFPINTNDNFGLSSFHQFSLQNELFPNEFNVKTSVFPVKCCSLITITFQVLSNDNMYLLYYIFYTLKVFYSDNKGNKRSSTNLKSNLIWQQFLNDRSVENYNISNQQYFTIWENYIDDPNTFNKKIKEQLTDYS